MKKSYIICSILILLVIYIGFFIYKKSPKENTEINRVTYFCQEGTLKAIYGKNYITLLFPDGQNMLLPQATSGSGIRYELGKNTFLSKGSNAFFTENNIDKYTKCVDGNIISEKDTDTYTDTAKTFSFSYPKEFILSGGDIGYSQDWSNGSDDSGILFTVVTIPQTFFTKTNFGEAKFKVGTTADEHAIKNCLNTTNGGQVVKGEVMINNIQFTKIISTDAGAGNYYETTSYRTLHGGQCYSIEYTIHSMNIYNYSPDQGIKEFDKVKITNLLESMTQSFKFI